MIEKEKSLDDMCLWRENSIFMHSKSCPGCDGYRTECGSYLTYKILKERDDEYESKRIMEENTK